MGGKAEDIIQTSKKSKMGDGGTIQGKEGPREGLPSETILRSEQELRYHESKGEVHFHDDAQKLKCAIPVAEWFTALNRLKTWQIGYWQYLDRKRGTLLRITAGKNEDGLFDLTVILTLQFEKTESGPVLEALEKFTFAVKS